MKCSFRRDSHCSVAADLAGLTKVDVCSDQACAVCTQHPVAPRARNKVTLDLACAALRQAGQLDRARQLMRSAPDVYQLPADRLLAVESGAGVGSQIWRLLAEIGVHHDPRCDCLTWAEKLNVWGVVGCRLARHEIVDHLRTARKQYGWARSIQAAAKSAAHAVGDLAAGRRPWLDPFDPYGSLVDEAIRRAEIAEQSTSVPGPADPAATGGNAA